MEFSSWLPQALALLPGLGGAFIGLFANRKKRVMNELDKLLELRARCEDGSDELTSLNSAIGSVSARLDEMVRRRFEPSGVFTVLFFGLLGLIAVYFLWDWAFDSGIFLAWGLAFVGSFVSVGFIAAGVPSMFTTDEEKEEAERARKARKAEKAANRARA